jgi:hypothetical protein
MIHNPATSLGIKDKSGLRVDSRAMYYNAPGAGEGK